MPILSERHALTNSPGTASAWPMQAAEMRERLGLGKKIGSDTAIACVEVQGYRVVVLSARAAAERAGHTHKPHRIFVECKMCLRSYPFGRMAQHERACRKIAR